MAKWYQTLTWKGLRLFYAPLLRRQYRVTHTFHDPEPSEPYILLANHAHITDPFIVGTCLKQVINYMANIEGANRAKQIFSELVGAYGKRKGAPDIAALRMTIEMLKKGYSIGIFPEGDRSWDGRTVSFQAGTANLVKKMKVPLLLGHISGHYLTWPRWASNSRKGRIHIDFHTVTVEQITEMSVAELDQLIADSLKSNDLAIADNMAVPYQGKNYAEGIEYLLWMCPSCQSHDTITGKGDSIRCAGCGREWNLDGHLNISGGSVFSNENLQAWTDWQKRQVHDLCRRQPRDSDEPLTETEGIELSNFDSQQTVLSGSLQLFSDRMELHTLSGDPIVFPVSDIAHYVDNFNRTFFFSSLGKRWVIRFNGKSSYKWITFLNELRGISV